MTDNPDTGGAGLVLRAAEPGDCAMVLEFIRELAEYEGLAQEVVASQEILARSLFGARPAAEVVLAFLDGEAVGFAVFFHNFSTFLGQAGLYLEDLFVRPPARGKGVGRSILRYLARLAVDRGCGRMEWWVLDWNTTAIDFYDGLGAEAMDEWTVYRLSGDDLDRLAK
jgi:GNAT superfamily N-acetyltransferase